MVIGSERLREHPTDTSKGSRDLRSLQMLRNFRLRTPKGTSKGSSDLRSHPAAMLLLLKKKSGEKPGMRRTYFRSETLPVAHAHNILPDMDTSGHVTSGHAQWPDPRQMLICPYPYTTRLN